MPAENQVRTARNIADPRRKVRPVGLVQRFDGGGNPVLRQLVAHLPRYIGLVSGRIRAVRPDQLRKKINDLLFVQKRYASVVIIFPFKHREQSSNRLWSGPGLIWRIQLRPPSRIVHASKFTRKMPALLRKTDKTCCIL